jgi:hypothetical protein
VRAAITIDNHRDNSTPYLIPNAAMADSPASATSALPGESPAQTKARLRRERLAAKSGASRLQQITSLQGGPPKPLSELEKDVPGNGSSLLITLVST